MVRRPTAVDEFDRLDLVHRGVQHARRAPTLDLRPCTVEFAMDVRLLPDRLVLELLALDQVNQLLVGVLCTENRVRKQVLRDGLAVRRRHQLLREVLILPTKYVARF